MADGYLCEIVTHVSNVSNQDSKNEAIYPLPTGCVYLLVVVPSTPILELKTA